MPDQPETAPGVVAYRTQLEAEQDRLLTGFRREHPGYFAATCLLPLAIVGMFLLRDRRRGRAIETRRPPWR